VTLSRDSTRIPDNDDDDDDDEATTYRTTVRCTVTVIVRKLHKGLRFTPSSLGQHSGTISGINPGAGKALVSTIASAIYM
jgi:hypothetical protein